MKRFFISYDLKETDPEPHSDLLGLAEKYKLANWAPAKDNRLRHLPDTTLTGTFETHEEAYTAWKKLVSATSRKIGIPVKVEKLLIVQSANPFMISSDVDKPKVAPGSKSTALRIIALARGKKT
jgi:hypothetical protein